MFGKYDIGLIVEGHLNEITNKENDLYLSRIAICKKCPLYSERLGGVCDSKKFYNPETGEISNLPEEGFIAGCGCRLQAKTRLQAAKCVLNKW